MKASINIVVIFLIIAGTAFSELTAKAWSRIKPGMTEQQVTRFLGDPKDRESSRTVSVLYYQDVPIVEDGKIVSRPKPGTVVMKFGDDGIWRVAKTVMPNWYEMQKSEPEVTGPVEQSNVTQDPEPEPEPKKVESVVVEPEKTQAEIDAERAKAREERRKKIEQRQAEYEARKAEMKTKSEIYKEESKSGSQFFIFMGAVLFGMAVVFGFIQRYVSS